MTQKHYLESIRDNQGLDEQFRSLLRHHWMEEAQHAQLDTLMVEALAANCDERQIEQAVDGYLYTFGLVEEFILPFVLDHARPLLAQDDLRTRALLRFASEEAKHIHLFRTFEREFEAGFGTACDMIGPAEEVGKAVLAHHPLSWRS